MSTEESGRLSVTQCQNISLYLDHYQGGSEPGLNSIDNLYIPTSSLAICFSSLMVVAISQLVCQQLETSQVTSCICKTAADS